MENFLVHKLRLKIFPDIEKVREEARQKENRYLEIISQYEEQLKKYKEELHIYQRREEANQKTSKAEEARKGKRGSYKFNIQPIFSC